jgi:hypothetical protein
MMPTARTGRAVPRGIRNHNPGNLRRTADPWQGLAAEQGDPAFFQFNAAKWGIRALARTLIAYQDRHGLRTIAQVIARWAPPNENDTDSYIRGVSAAVGVGAEKGIDVHDHAVLRPLVLAIIRHENGEMPYTDAEIDAGLVLAGVEPARKALTATRTIQGGQVAAGATVLGMAVETIREVEPALPVVQSALQLAPWLVGTVALAGIAYMVWARIDDRRRGLR